MELVILTKTKNAYLKITLQQSHNKNCTTRLNHILITAHAFQTHTCVLTLKLHLLPLALNHIPTIRQLQHISQLDYPPPKTHTPPYTTQISGPALLGGCILPIPAKLVKKITERTLYIHMAELHPEHLNVTDEEPPKALKLR